MSLRNPRTLAGLVLALSLSLGGCGGGGGGGDATLPISSFDFYVDALGGSDSNGDGSALNPFASLTKAISVAQPGDRIKAQPGMYDVANGEQFPIVVPPSVELVGDPDGRGDGSIPTLIHGHGAVSGYTNMQAALVPMAQSRIVGFTITNDHESADPFVYDIGIFVNASDVEIFRNTIRANVDNGVRFYEGADDGVFSTNVMEQNGTALTFRHGGLRTRVEYNKITGNNAGVILMTADAGDFGGGPAGSAGNNIFAGNSSADFMLFTGGGAFFFAENNYWNHLPPTTHVGINPGPPAGVDLWYASGDTIKIDGAKKYLILQYIPVPGWTIQP